MIDRLVPQWFLCQDEQEEFVFYVYSSTKETHQSLLGEILENRIKK